MTTLHKQRSNQQARSDDRTIQQTIVLFPVRSR